MTWVRAFFARERVVLIVMLLASLVAHSAAFWMVSPVERVGPSGWRGGPRVHLMLPSLDTSKGRRSLYLLADRLDPSLISVPSPYGFSGKMWSKTVPVQLQPQGWNIDPAYLEAHPAPVIPTLLPQPPVTGTLQAAVNMVVSPPSAPSEHLNPTASMPNRSTFQLRGGLETRATVKSPALPAVAHQGGLRPTTLRVGVGADGSVNYAAVERPSGSDWADARALELARQIQFEPVSRGEELEWGIVRFFWAITPPERPGTGGKPGS